MLMVALLVYVNGDKCCRQHLKVTQHVVHPMKCEPIIATSSVLYLQACKGLLALNSPPVFGLAREISAEQETQEDCPCQVDAKIPCSLNGVRGPCLSCRQENNNHQQLHFVTKGFFVLTDSLLF